MSWTEDSWVANGLLLVRSHQLMSLAFLVGTYIVRVAIQRLLLDLFLLDWLEIRIAR